MEFEAPKERLVDKKVIPTQEIINHFMGDKNVSSLYLFEKMLRESYDLNCELKFPFGKSYGWAYRYTHKKALLLYVFPEKDGFCCTISINDSGAGVVVKILNTMLPKTKELWQNRYPCGKEGGWVHYSVSDDKELKDIVQMINIKVPPQK